MAHQVHDYQAKVLLSSSRQPDPWFGIKYTMNLYRGCQHQCIYCDSRSECYHIDNFADILVKANSTLLTSPDQLADEFRKSNGRLALTVRDVRTGRDVLVDVDPRNLSQGSGMRPGNRRR